MNISNYFNKLKAPLKNNRYSWGGVKDDGTVVLRCWNEERIKFNGVDAVLVDKNDYGDYRSHGINERREHLELIKSGASSLLVMCTAKDVDAPVWEIATFTNKSVFVTGELIEHEGNRYLSIVDRKVV
jgi:hypothetical protein